ncbi:MAG: ComF family protein [Actinobacteria bacterium]|nr:ComF family protein [Actinomycetota bacterium]
MKTIGNMLGGFIDLLFPPRRVCPLCGKFQEDKRICDSCLNMLGEFREEPVCYKCGRFFHIPEGGQAGGGPQAAYCRDCLGGGRFFFMARAAGPYDGDLKRAVRRLKYNGRRELAGHLSGIMFDRISANRYYNRVEIITPVPLSPGRLRQRGYNQAELLAFGLSGRMKVPVLPLLKKNRETAPQTSLDRPGRGENLRDAFTLTGAGAFRGKTILLVDDVVTTGVTLNTVSETLVRGGAGVVLCIAAAAGRTAAAGGERSF